MKSIITNHRKLGKKLSKIGEKCRCRSKITKKNYGKWTKSNQWKKHSKSLKAGKFRRKWVKIDPEVWKKNGLKWVKSADGRQENHEILLKNGQKLT